MNAIKEFRKKLRAEIIALLKARQLTYEEIARSCDCTVSTVYSVAKENKLRRRDRAGKEN